MELVFATGNKHKLKEAQEILDEMLGGTILLKTPSDFGIDEDIPETGETLLENALQKANYIWDRLHIPCFADDTGLEVDYLNGAPGVHSARYAGEGKNSMDNVRKLLHEMAFVPEGKGALRSARFRCVAVLIINGQSYPFEGISEGEITILPSGEGGFGYDPVFRPAGYEKCFSELSSEEKNAISHRGKAMRLLSQFLLTLPYN